MTTVIIVLLLYYKHIILIIIADNILVTFEIGVCYNYDSKPDAATVSL